MNIASVFIITEWVVAREPAIVWAEVTRPGVRLVVGSAESRSSRTGLPPRPGRRGVNEIKKRNKKEDPKVPSFTAITTA
jgi:hypothetical protein